MTTMWVALIALLVPVSQACLGGGGQACCPPAAPVCAPSLPRCPSGGGLGGGMMGARPGLLGGGTQPAYVILPSSGGGLGGGLGGLGGGLGGISSGIGGIGGGGSYAAPAIGGMQSAPAMYSLGGQSSRYPQTNSAGIGGVSGYAQGGPSVGFNGGGGGGGYQQGGMSSGFNSVGAAGSNGGSFGSSVNSVSSNFGGAAPSSGYGSSNVNSGGGGFSEHSSNVAPPTNVEPLPLTAPSSESTFVEKTEPAPAPVPAPAPIPTLAAPVVVEPATVPPRAPAPATLPAPEETMEYAPSVDNAYEEISGDLDTEASIGTNSAPPPAPVEPAPHQPEAPQPATGTYEESNSADPYGAPEPSGGFSEEVAVAAVEPASTGGEEGICDNAALKAIVKKSLENQSDNLEAARTIESEASKMFGGRFNAVVSDAEFAYVNWFDSKNCQLKVGNRHTLTWQD